LKPPTGPEIVAEFAARGIRLGAEGGKIRVTAPPGRMTPDLRDLLKGNKGPLLAALTGRPVPTATEGVCWHPTGGVALCDPERPARLAVWRYARRLGFPRVPRADWVSFTTTAPIIEVLEVLMALEGEGTQKAEEAACETGCAGPRAEPRDSFGFAGSDGEGCSDE
jgi:hypothetical protein